MKRKSKLVIYGLPAFTLRLLKLEAPQLKVAKSVKLSVGGVV